MTGALTIPEGNEALWHEVFAVGHPVLAGKHRRFGLLPGSPRCRLCHAPMGGIGGMVMRVRGLRASNRNPNYCNVCDGFLEAFPGGAEVPMSMMMVDIRNSVALSAEITPTAYARLVAAMREDVLTILEETDGFVLEFQGDCVFGVWPPGFVGPSHAAKAIEAAGRATQIFSRRDSSSYVGIGVHTGPIYVGTLSAPGGRFFGIGAFGLNVNILARLTHAAAAGEALVSTATFETAGVPVPADRVRHESLKGIEVPVSAVSLRRPELAAP